MVIMGLLVVLMLVLVLPFSIHKVEENLEPFLFVMGICAALISGLLNKGLVIKALEEPIMITSAVLIAGFLFHYFNAQIRKGINQILNVLPLRVFVFLVTVILGLLSSVITAIIASLVLVEIINAMDIERKVKIKVDIVACFAIGLGAALTPIGEPLSTIAVSKMNQDFWYLVRLLGVYIVPAIIAMGMFSSFLVKTNLVDKSIASTPAEGEHTTTVEEKPETYLDVIIRAAKVYLFVMALVFLGEGFKPMIDRYILGLSNGLLYWINMISAVLDNATLTAAELSPQMSASQVQAILMGLLISGGMLIPGNIPNIISAGKLKIGSREWAKLGIPLGLATMATYFVILIIL